MITINKECIHAYLEMSEIQNQITSIEDGLEKINREETDSFFMSHSYEIKRMAIINFYNQHKNLIEYSLKEEVKKLKEELNKYTIE